MFTHREKKSSLYTEQQQENSKNLILENDPYAILTYEYQVRDRSEKNQSLKQSMLIEPLYEVKNLDNTQNFRSVYIRSQSIHRQSAGE